MNEPKQMNDVFESLFKLIEDRKTANPKESYTAGLFKKGKGKICKKLGEETFETVIAALNEKKENVVHESADMLFHLLVLWAKKEIEPRNVSEELKIRFGVSGIEEKKGRSILN